MKIEAFALRPGAIGPGLAAGIGALAGALGANEVSAALARNVGRRASVPVLEVGASSRIRDAAYLLWDDHRFEDDAVFDALEASAHTEHAFWGRDDFEPYRALAAPLPAPLPGALPAYDTRWAIVEGVSAAEARARLVTLGLADAQLHTFAPRSLRSVGIDPSVVRWLDRSAIVAAVLGRASAVVTSDATLAMDAERIGRTLVRVGPPEPRARARLVTTVPPVLLEDPVFVRALVAHGPDHARERLRDLGFRRARLHAVTAGGPKPDTLARLGKRFRKLREDPDRFFAESRFQAVRSTGQLVRRRLRKP